MKKKITAVLLCLVMCLSLFPISAFAADDCEAYHEDLPTIEWANANIASHGSCMRAQESQIGKIPEVYILGGAGYADGYSEVSGVTGYALYWHMQDFRIQYSDGFYYYPSEASIDYWCNYKGADRSLAKLLDDYSITLNFNNNYTKNIKQGQNEEISQEMWDLEKNIQMQYSALYPNGVTLTKAGIGNNAATGNMPVQGETGETQAFCHFLYDTNATNIKAYLKPLGDYETRDQWGQITLTAEQDYEAVGAESAEFSFIINGKKYNTDLMNGDFGLTYHDRCYGVALGGNFGVVKPEVHTVTIQKTVDRAELATLPENANNTEFSFSMTLKDTEGKMHTCDIPYKKGTENGTLTTTNGNYHFTLKSGESISFESPVSTTSVIQLSENNIPENYVSSYQVNGSAWEAAAVTSEIAVNQDTVISFNNLYAPSIYTLTYHVEGDSVYGTPTDSVTPSPVTGIAWNGKVDPLAEAPTTSWTTSDGTNNGVPGEWTFSPAWSSDTTYADELTKVEGIKTNVDVYGKWIFTPDTYKVTYVVEEDTDWGKPDDSVIPTDGTAYDYKDDVTVAPDLTTTQGYAKDKTTGENVPGTWTFTPWDKDDFQITEDTTITGSWKFTPNTSTLTYHVEGDSVYGVPTDSVTPSQVTNIAWNGKVDPLAESPTTSWKTSDGTDEGIPGKWTFSPAWSSDTTYADELTKVEGIKTDVNVYGKWTFTPDTYKVTYVVEEDTDWGKPDDSVTPTDSTAYDYKDDVTVAPDLTTTQGYAKDKTTGENVPGTWTFTPWDKDDFQITEDTTITGKWTFTPDTYEVTYIVNGDPVYGTPAGGTAPTDEKNPYDYKEQVTVKDNLTTSWTTSDGTDSGIPGAWIFTPWDKDDFQITEDTTVTGSWTFTPYAYKVTYVVEEDTDWGKPDDSVTPTDGTAYDYKDDVTVAPDLTTVQSYAKDKVTGENVPGTWAFTPWDKDDFQITEDTTVTGKWTFTPDTCKVTYVVNGDPTYGTPAGGTAPTDENNPYDYKEQVTVKDNLTTSWTTSDGTDSGIPGTWTFTPWDKDDFQITEDTTITGSWKFTPALTGNLTISKNVTGDLGDKTKYFTFKVEFDSDKTFRYTGSKNGTISSGDIIQLKHGESITIFNVPAGTGYTVTESRNSGYTVYASGDTGIIAEGKTSTAKFTNTRSSVPKTGDDSNINLWFALLAISGACMIGAAVIGRKRYAHRHKK